jgi:hypothetical protein
MQATNRHKIFGQFDPGKTHKGKTSLRGASFIFELQKLMSYSREIFPALKSSTYLQN